MLINGVEVDAEYLGKHLLEQGFATWFRYMFRIVEKEPFIMEAMHSDLLQVFEDLYNGKIKKQNTNICPRGGKTTVNAYFQPYCLARNPKCNFIYTSYSQTLLADVSRQVMKILEHPVYKAMYRNSETIQDEEIKPIDDFWKDYLEAEQEKKKKKKRESENQYSNKKIITREGGVLLFASIGSQITGYGYGRRSTKEFGGMLIIDDANKPGDINSPLMRSNVHRYFTETLLTRGNNSEAPIHNVQQRLHMEDLSGYLINNYNFNTLKKPLLDENGICQLPKQYTPERIADLQVKPYTFQSQYQQEPIPQGGTMIKSEWFKYYSILPEFKRIFMTGDTAQKTKEHNDYSVFCIWGQFNQELYLLDMIRGKWEAPELLINCENAVKKWQSYKKPLSEIILEDKASGTGLIQTLKRTCRTPIKALQVDKDKVTRVDDCTPYLANGYMYLPNSREYSFNPVLINECELFCRDNSHKHDDIVDNITMAVQHVSLSNKRISFFNV